MKTALVVIFALMVLIGIVVSAFAADATLTWTANTESDLAGYKVYFGQLSCKDAGPLQLRTTLGKVTTYFQASLPVIDGTVAWQLTAYDLAGNESAKSVCVEKVLNGLPPVAPVAPTVTITP